MCIELTPHLVVEQQLPLVLREDTGDGAGGTVPFLVDGDVQRAEMADAAAATAAGAAVVGRRSEEDGDGGV